MITVSAFRWVPEFAQGQVRDLRVRWALEEIGLPYQTRLLGQGDNNTAEYLALQPFGQVPIYEEDGHALFESGAIVLHIGAKSTILLPADVKARARATQWLIAALNSVEPFIMNVAQARASSPSAGSQRSARRWATSPISTATASPPATS
jgi:glutathione S-transferase